MNTKKMRIAIVKDVLERIDNRDIAINSYLRMKDILELKSRDAQKDIEEYESKCQVCALGACFLSYIRLYNNIENNQINTQTDYMQQLIKDTIGPIFTKRNLAMIEAAFEQHIICDPIYSSECMYIDLQRAIKFSNKKIAADRLIDIMNNIIENDGEFKP